MNKMILSRNEQIRFAKELLPLAESTPTLTELERINALASLVLELSGSNDNGVAFDISEYTYELLDIAKGNKAPDGWAEEARQSLVNQIEDQ